MYVPNTHVCESYSAVTILERGPMSSTVQLRADYRIKIFQKEQVSRTICPQPSLS